MKDVLNFPGHNSRRDLTRYLQPLCAGAGLWTVRHSQPVKPHAMPNFEINYVHAGEMTTFFDDGSRMQARGGDVSVIQPGVWHHCEHNAMSPVNYLVFMVDPQSPRPCPPFSHDETDKILRLLRRSGNRAAHAYEGTDDAFLALREALVLPAAKRKAMWFDPWVRNLVQQVFLCVLRALESPVRSPHYAPVDRARRLIEQQLGEPLSLTRLAGQLDVSPTRLTQLFRRQLGCTPTEYRMRLRLHEAVRKLRNSSASVTAIAGELGFSNSQHLAASFRKYFGLTPTAYRWQTQQTKAAGKADPRSAGTGGCPEGAELGSRPSSRGSR